MTENDYIAEYIRLKHPHILGIDYVMWRFVYVIGNLVKHVAESIGALQCEDFNEDEDERGGEQE